MTRSAFGQEHAMEQMEGEGVTARDDVLIIEDSPTQAEQLCDILERNSYRVSSAANGREALAALAVRRPALIISDIIMPEMDGYELCRRIKADKRYRDIPVMLLTSLSNPRDVIRGLECGADNFITKPYNEEYLVSRIRRIEADRRSAGDAECGKDLKLHFGGEEYVISADRRQILNLLLSTYETAVQQNSELSRARDELRGLNEQLETANKELEAFGYTVSHDLRTPLTCITGYCQLLADTCADRLDGQGREFIQEIRDAAGRMGQLITTILNFSQLTRKTMVREKVNLSVLAKAVALDLRMREPQRPVTFRIADGGAVNGDAKLMRVVMDNLIGNAWKYSAKRPDAVIEFGLQEQAGETVFFIRDNGAGFDMAYADRLFAAFERLHDAEEFDGIGIGLATVKRIIERHGGRIWAEGEEGKGATFFFTLGESPQ